MDKVVHFEIPFDDQKRATKFYQDVFKWRTEDVPDMNYVMAYSVETDEKHMPKESAAINGGMMKRNDMVKGPTFAINVDSIEEAIGKIKKAGGTVVMGKTAIGDMGFMAYFKDTEGNVLSVWQNAS